MNTKLSVRLAAVALTALASLVQASLAQAADAPKPLDRAALIKIAND